MADLKQFEFFLLRYVPDAVKGEFVNIGFMLHEAGASETKTSLVTITDDWKRAKCMNPDLDLEVLSGIGPQLQRELDEAGWDKVLHKMQDQFSNGIEVSPAMALQAADSAQAADRLMKDYLRARAGGGEERISPRERIVTTMEGAFGAAGVLGFMQRNIRVADYTGKRGDPQKFDFAYPLPGEVRFLHGLSLSASLQPALILGARFPAIAADIYRAHDARARLTLVVEDDLDRQRDDIGFALGLMAENQIRVAEAREALQLAAEIREELGV
ncbi:MAG TPA: DUF3037 domain-containing protein [Terriglobales bacterium]|nr:DUF3037 domain-containing protein [Terriglobales bacterium]